ncbi:GntR family transcriptional regulator, partial [Staphylococcus aureus]
MTTQRGRNRKVISRTAGKANPAEDEAVYQAILHALLEGKLKAGTKLAEPPLADLFGVSRERIR